MSSLFGLLGEKLGHSISPQIHSMVFDALNIKGEYHLFEIKRDEVRNIISKLKGMNVKGVNVTIPYKTEIMNYLDDISGEAQKIGAVNTVSFSGGQTIGFNTDYNGFGATLKKYEIEVPKSSAVVLGTGGAAKAVVQYLIDNNIYDLKIVTRDLNAHNRTGYTQYIDVIGYEKLKSLNNMDIIINCTPCGMYPDVNKSPVDTSDIKRFSTAIDLIYNPKETLFLKSAKQSGLKTINGTYMLVSQALASEEIWNDIKISQENVDIIYESISRLLAK